MKILSPKLPPYKASEQSWLVIFTFLYLGIPNLIFVLGWLHWYIAIPVSLALLWSGWRIYLENKEASLPWAKSEITKKALWLMVIVVTVWLLVAGSGGVFRQFGDYEKHNSIVRELTEKAWPVILGDSDVVKGETTFLCYYLGYYLPTAFLSKLTHIQYANIYLFIWTWIGVVLTFFWIRKLAGLKKGSLLFLIFPLLAGLDVYAAVYRLVQSVVHHGFDDSFWEIVLYNGLDGMLLHNWGAAAKAQNFNYRDINRFISWMPQHAMGAWLAGAWIYWEGSFKKKNIYIGLIVVLTINISTLAAIGCVFLALVYLFRNDFKTNFSTHNLFTAIGLGLVMLSFLLAHYPISPKGFLWEFINWRTIPFVLFFFYLIEFGIYAFLVHPFYRMKSFKTDFLMVIGILILLPFYKLGFYNDWLIDVPFSILLIFWILIIRFLAHARRNLRFWVFVFLLATAALTPIHMMSMSIMGSYLGAEFFPISTPEHSPWITDVEFRDVITKQYMGKTDSFFWKYLAKK
ncbi:hypothetical protein R9C00_23500 [Flammeovirgaceae bacterium SG7u.111]|nr:hypothetical protein [Flammeovirgaceae bacterium SG7u.132]WPO34671.1 hypothetical protein R9C00_23500 [Flammeovirgaceae bacterium SG7u.111]